jgi:hypothetical protein
VCSLDSIPHVTFMHCQSTQGFTQLSCGRVQAAGVSDTPNQCGTPQCRLDGHAVLKRDFQGSYLSHGLLSRALLAGTVLMWGVVC